MSWRKCDQQHIVQGRINEGGRGVTGNVFNDHIRPLGRDVTQGTSQETVA